MSRRLLVFCAALCLVPHIVTAQPDAWPMYGHDAAHTCRTSHRGALTASLVPAIPGAAFQAAVGPDGTFYGAFRDGFDDFVRAYRPDGTLKWEWEAGFSSIVASLAVGPDGTLYAVVDDDTLHAFDGTTGSEKWSRALGFVSRQSKLTIGSDGAIYIGIALNASSRGELRVFRPDGSVKWSWDPAIASCGIESTPAIGAAGVVYVQHNCAGLVSLNEATGAENWRFPGAGDPFNSPSVGPDGTIYIGDGERRFLAINPAGTLRWSVPVTGFMFYTAQAISADGLTIYRGDNEGILYAFNSTGSIKWTYDTGTFGPLSNPTVASNGLVFVRNTAQTLFALRESDGTLVWSSPTGGINELVVGPDGTFYVSGETIYKFKHVGAAPVVTVKSPNTAVDWGIGSRQAITWQHNVGSNEFMKIEVSRDGGATYVVIAPSVKNTSNTGGTFQWQVTGPATTMARVRVTWNGDPSGTDASNANFKIADPFIQLTAPKGGSNWGYDTTQAVAWKTNLGPTDRVNVLYTTDGSSFSTLKSNTLATKKTNVVAPTLGAPTSTARIKVIWANPTSGVAPVDDTSPMFTIAPPFINVTAPAMGAVWTVGTKTTILFPNNLGTLEKVRIELSKDGGSTYPILIVANSKADGKHAVTVNDGWAEQTTTRVRVTWLKTAGVTGTSAQFTVRR